VGRWPIFRLLGSEMIRQAPTKILNLLEPVIVGLGYEFVGAEFLPQGRHSLLRIYIDTTAGITVDDCEIVSRQVSSMLDVEDPVSGNYTLEVSSPGLDRLLFKLQDFERFVGHEIKLTLSSPVNNRRKMKAMLKSVGAADIRVDLDGEEIDIDFENIEKARLVPDFD